MRHFFDIGANIGQTFRDYINKHSELDDCTVWCFEPSPRHWQELAAVAKEQSERYHVHICPFGLGGRNEIRAFYIKDDPRGDSFYPYLASDHETANKSEGYSLHAVSVGISDFILSHTDPGDEIILKLDCEGSEYEILAWLLLSPEAFLE